MSAYTTPRKSLRFRKNEPSPFLHDRKRELFPVDNWDDDSHDIIPLQSSPEIYDPGLASPETPCKVNCTPVTELSPTMSNKFEKMMSESKNGNVCSATIVIEETPSFRRVKHVNTTPFESETNKEAKTPSKKNVCLNEIKSNNVEFGVKTSSFYGGNQISLEDLRLKRFTRLHSNPKVKAKLFKDSKSTSKKRPRSISREKKTKTNLFPGILLPCKKKSTAKKLFTKTEVCDENTNLMEENVKDKKDSFDFPKPSFKKNDWTEYIKQEKPERINIESPDNRKFFKSKIIQNDTSYKKDNSFNLKVVNLGGENRMSIKAEETDFSAIEILDDNAIEQIGQEVNDLIDLLEDDEDDSHSTPIRYPGLTLKSTKRDHEDNDADSCMSKRIKVQKHNHDLRCQMPDLIKDAYNFDENQDKYYSSSSSPVIHPKDLSNTIDDMAVDEPAETLNHDQSILNGPSDTKLFPIFTNQTSFVNAITFTEKSTPRKVKRIIDATQYQIDAGQKKFGGFMCKQCGLYYSRGEPEDEAEHDKYHLAKEIFKYNTFKYEKIVYQDLNERIIVISGSDSKIICSKALEVMSFVDQELGFNTQISVLPTTKKVYLYIKNKQVIGCLVVELISQAYRNLETETEDMVIVSEESYPVKVGVNRIWTKWDYRGNGVATKLLDCFRKNYSYGHILTLGEIAFTVPTRAGKQFIKKYTNKNDYLVYTGW